MNIAKIYYCDNYDFDSEKYLHLLPESRQKKYHRLKQDVDKKNCVGAYLLLKLALENEGITDFEMLEGEMGKPYLKSGEIYFNLSHCKYGFACAISKKEIGIDIEGIALPRPLMLKKAFSEAEQKSIAHSNVNFTRLWTLKESVIKRYGESIGSYKKYEFPLIETDFYCWDNRFISFNNDKFVLSACGDFEKYEIIKTETVER